MPETQSQVLSHLYWNVVAFIALLDANESPETCGSTLNSHFDCLRLYGGGQHHMWSSPSLGLFWVLAKFLWMWRASIAQFVSLPFPFIPYQCPDFIRGYSVAQKCVNYHGGVIKGWGWQWQKHFCAFEAVSCSYAFNHHIGVTIILYMYIHNMASKLCDVQMVALKPFCSFDSIVATIFDSTHI